MIVDCVQYLAPDLSSSSTVIVYVEPLTVLRANLHFGFFGGEGSFLSPNKLRSIVDCIYIYASFRQEVKLATDDFIRVQVEDYIVWCSQ